MSCGHIALPPDGDDKVGLIVVENFKRRALEGGLEAVIDDKFSDGQECSLVILPLVCEHAKVLFNFLIHTLCLSICLGVIGLSQTSEYSLALVA